MDSIAAVVVTYNRLGLLQGCIQSLRQQTKIIDRIIVVNNGSNDGTQNWLETQHDLLVIHQSNSGGAGGFHTGIKVAFQKGYRWIWVMDDDCVADLNCLNNMFFSLNLQPVLCVAPMVLSEEGLIDVRHRGYFNFASKLNMGSIQVPIEEDLKRDTLIDFASFVGLMISSKIIEKVGLPREDFFIHNDDVEYCIRIGKASKILLSTQAKILHLEKAVNTNIRKQFLIFKNERVPIEKLWIKYYGIRNLIWIRRTYMINNRLPNRVHLVLHTLKSLAKNLQEVIFYDDFKRKRAFFYLNAFLDGWRGSFDNDKPKKILP